MSNYTTRAGMDVHARSITIQALVVETGETLKKTLTGNPSVGEVAEWLMRLPQPIYCAYESGCTGFHLARDLRAMGIDCDVIAVSTLPRSTKDRQGKCDRLDARAILREICNPEPGYTTVWIPDEKTEAGRNLARACEQASRTLKRAKQELVSFLLTHGFVWDEKTKSGNQKKAWTQDWWRWARALSFPQEADRIAFNHYVKAVKWAEEEVKEMKRLIAVESEKPENKPYVDALTRVNGIDVATAYLARVEFGDFSRFSSGRKVSSWVGVVPSNNSSGEREAHGSITKSGNKYLRRRCVESVGTIANWKRTQKPAKEGSGVTCEVEGMAATANVRLMDRYRHLTAERKKHANKAKVAVVSEMVRWIWAIGLQVQREQEAA